MKKPHIVLLVVVIAALAGGGSAIAAKGHSTAGGPHGGPPGLTGAATYLGTTESALRTQLQSGKTLAQIANATSGKSAAGLIAALVADATATLGANAPADLEQHITNMVNGIRGGPGGFGHDHGGGGPQLDAAATYLGTTATALRTQLAAGKTLAQIANATTGKSASGLIDALVADARTHITQLVNGS